MHLHNKGDMTENKLILLYALRKLGMSAPMDALADLVLTRDWMNYFDMHQMLLELKEAGLIDERTPGTYTLTTDGLQALENYKKRIPFSIRDQIADYCRLNGQRIAREADILADYQQDSSTEFPVELAILENGLDVFRIKLVAPSREQAERVCARFRLEAADLYARLVHHLVREEEEETPE